MKILICGANGFVGRNLAAALNTAGHEIIKGVRHAKNPDEVHIDYRHDTDAAIWLPRLVGVDAVVNAVGVLRDSAALPMSLLHDAAPRALFSAAAQSGVQRIVQISALGVGTGIAVAYMQTKQRADEFLQTLPLDATILRPSLIYGSEAAGTRMFIGLAHLPLLMLPDAGRQLVQPVHINDLATAVVNLFLPQTHSNDATRIIDCVGTEAVSVADLISSYRVQRGKNPPKVLAVPKIFMRLMCDLGDKISALPIGSDTMAMLTADSTASGAEFEKLLGHHPISYRDFIAMRA